MFKIIRFLIVVLVLASNIVLPVSGVSGQDEEYNIKVTRLINQAIPNNVNTLVDFDSYLWGNEAMSQDGKIVVLQEGKYLVIVCVTFKLNATGIRQLIVYKNDSIEAVDSVPANASTYEHLYRSAVIECLIGDEISVQVMQNSGVELELYHWDYYSPFITAYMLTDGASSDELVVSGDINLVHEFPIGYILMVLGVMLLLVNIWLRSPIMYLGALACWAGVYLDDIFFDTWIQAVALIVMIVCLLLAFFKWRSNKSERYG